MTRDQYIESQRTTAYRLLLQGWSPKYVSKQTRLPIHVVEVLLRCNEATAFFYLL
jgi:hypothetical protein